MPMSTLRFSWNKLNCLPQDQSLSVFMVNGLSRSQVPAFASFNLLHLKRCPFSVSWSKYPERIDWRKNILVNSNYKGLLQYLRGFFAYSALLCDFSTKPILVNGGSLMGAVFHHAIKTSLSLNYNFTTSLLFLNFKLPQMHIGQGNYQTCRPASKLECKVRLTDKILLGSKFLALIAPRAVNNRTSLSLDDFIADTKKYIEIYMNHQTRPLLSTRCARNKF